MSKQTIRTTTRTVKHTTRGQVGLKNKLNTAKSNLNKKKAR